MKTKPVSRDGLARIFALGCWGLCFTIACALAARAPARGPGGAGFLERIAGTLRPVLGAGFVERADLFFHRGVGHAADREVVRHDFFRTWRTHIRPEDHTHLSGHEAAEMLPWLMVATVIDPEEVETWLTAAYWLERVGAPSERVVSVYRDARQANPRDYRIYDQWAGYSLRIGNKTEAEQWLVRAVQLATEENPVERPPPQSLAYLWARRGLLREIHGDLDAAAELYRRALDADPGYTLAEERKGALVNRPAEAPGEARQILRRLSVAEKAERESCGHHH